ncbi:hypothetical protein AJ80_06588 [Polytolypa hystricis UAMH7299]|uniref:Uncharacterized protein n=1 Tax=Polytolypa hystricis (strain UAMH7299) TaxID=1447883 RepID=A0A2B7XLY2_POLH7|nr:hypothetical protein AJ80_06588 [Polytolypa hystricis UAMH7299]
MDKIIEMIRGGRATMGQHLREETAGQQNSPKRPGQVVEDHLQSSSNRSDGRASPRPPERTDQAKKDKIFPDWAGAVRAAKGKRSFLASGTRQGTLTRCSTFGPLRGCLSTAGRTGKRDTDI